MPRQKPKEGDIFEISLENGEVAIGQVLSIEPQALNSIGCAFWEPSNSPNPEQIDHPPISALLVTPELLKRGIWKIISNRPPTLPTSLRPYEQFRASHWVGATITGSGIIAKFMQSCAGLRPWNKQADPNYLDELLLPGVARPQRAVIELEP
ncbi:hypothetical protein D3C85_1368520 [compost metagenome]